MTITVRTVRSSLLGNERRVWLQSPPLDQSPQAICILLDGEYYVERMDVIGVIDELQRTGLPPFAVAYVSHVNGQARWTESKCNDRFCRFVSEELVGWVIDQFGQSARNLPMILGGLSLTGLAAAHVGLRTGSLFSGVLCQSASFWWSEQWLVNEFRSHPPVPMRFRISCGLLETTEFVDHGPDMVQRTSQVASNRAMRDMLRNKGCDVSYEEFIGGHDLGSWKADLPKSLAVLLRSNHDIRELETDHR